MVDPILSYWSFWNSLAFRLRSLLRFSRSGLFLFPDDMEDLFEGERREKENYLGNLLYIGIARFLPGRPGFFGRFDQGPRRGGAGKK
jgi:hypothetical protein